MGLACVLVAACGTGTTNTPSALVSPSVDVFQEGARLESGSYTLDLDELTITIEVPSGWKAWAYGVSPAEGGSGPPSGMGLGFWLVDNIYANPCGWNSGLLDPPPGPLPADLAMALKDQRGRFATKATSVTLAGRQALRMELTVPPELDFSRCWDQTFLSWPQRDPPGGGRSHQGPGQHDRLWILDVDGTRLVVDASFFPDTPAADRAELWRIVRSVEVN